MKKRIILGSTLLVAVAMVTFVSASNNDAKASLLRQNVEAVAGGENPNCPNGCKVGNTGCKCNGYYDDLREASL